jgi:hypothetical protein
MNTDTLKSTLDDIQILALRALNGAGDLSVWEAHTAEAFAKALADIEALARNK